MSEIGIVRELDSLGRIVVPKEIRYAFDIKEKEGLEIFTDDNNIILKKFERGCIFCGEAASDKLSIFKKKSICDDCMKELTK